MNQTIFDSKVMTLWNSIYAERDALVEHLAAQVLAAPLHFVQGLTPSMIPQQAGVYVFYSTGIEQPFHIGESKNLRQRIYQNQLRGELRQSPLQRTVKN